jgi:tripartite ATP-independent transporter DctM subunit
MMVWIAFILLVVLILLGAPVPACFGGAVMFLMFTLGYDGNMLLNTAYNSLNAYNLLAIPLFIMAGGIMEKGNIGEALVGWITMFFGRVRASLAIVTSVVSAIFGSVCGSGAATLSCIGSMVAPRMREKNYPMAIGASVSVCAAPLGLLIPPSAMQILYAFLTQKSVLGCFLAIVIPGIILCILIAIAGWFLMKNDENIIREEPLPKGQKGRIIAKRTVHAVPALLMPFIILGGIYGGIMTATEAAAVSIIYSIPVSMWIYKGMKARDMKKVFTDTACTTGVVMVMVGFVMMFARVLTLEKFPQTVLEVFMGISDNKYVILLMVNIFMVIIGMIMDDTSGTILITPILMPLLENIGVSPYQFAAIIGVNMGMGNITPPSAPFLYLGARIFRVDATDMMKPILQIILMAYVPTLILVTWIPDLSLFLPRLLMGDKLGI